LYEITKEIRDIVANFWLNLFGYCTGRRKIGQSVWN